MKNATIGDIACLANGIPNTDDNKRMLVEIYNPQKDVPKTQEIKDNTLVVPYESVHDINVQEVVDYVKRSKGSL